MYKMVMVRHGQSEWNLSNRFTGWTDVGLTPQGEQEALEGGKLLLENGYVFDVCYTSYLRRAITTLHLIQGVMDNLWLPVIKSWRLNERHYGSLQGLNKKEMADKFGEEQVFVWRRSYDTPPPALEDTDERFPGKDPRYAALTESELPHTESLKLTVDRVMPYWENELGPAIKSGKRLLIAAHGNSMRALVKYLDNISDEEITKLNIPTGVPLVYELDADLKPIKSYYLGDQDAIAAKAKAVAEQASKGA